MATCPPGSTTIACFGEDCKGFPCCASLTADGNVLSAHCRSTLACDPNGPEKTVLCIGTLDCPNATDVFQCCPTPNPNYSACGGSGPQCN